MSAMRFFGKPQPEMVTAGQALPGRPKAMPVTDLHVVLGHPLLPPYPPSLETAIFALGCFWGAERKMWQTNGVWTTAAGYCGGFTANPTYDEVCSGKTGHAEAVLVAFDPLLTQYETLVQLFFESHDPTQYLRQGNDVGTQYRSAILTTSAAQEQSAATVAATYGAALASAGLGAIRTEIVPAGPFYFAEDEHQQYLAKNPHGYCGLGGTGVSCPTSALDRPL